VSFGIAPAATVSITLSLTGLDSLAEAIGGPHRVAVHRGVIEAGDIARRADLFGEYAAECLQDRHSLDPEHCHVGKNDFKSLIGASHRTIKNTRVWEKLERL
jgi:hypothetical protein